MEWIWRRRCKWCIRDEAADVEVTNSKMCENLSRECRRERFEGFRGMGDGGCRRDGVEGFRGMQERV